MPLEIAVDSASQAGAALPFADRLELCRDLQSHGLTPPSHLVRSVRREIDAHSRPVELVVLVRPVVSMRLTDADVSLCARQIAESIDSGADALAFGALDAAGAIDRRTLQTLIEACRGKPAVLHRAFDFAPDRAAAVEVSAQLGFSRVLSAGVSSFDHASSPLPDRIAALRLAAARAGSRFAVVACAGVRAANAVEFACITPELHSSCRINGAFDAAEAAGIRAALAVAR